jgi:type II secretory pathway pseudopilin PulG
MLEVIIAITLMLVAFAGVLSTVVSTTNLNRTNREMGLAAEAAQATIESMKNATLAEVFARFNASPADDPGGAGTSPGRNFAVPGLNVRPGDADGFVGEIQFPTAGNQLREDVVDAALGMPRDLNLDLAVDGADHSLDYGILPVRVRVQWTGAGGNRQIDIVTTLANL